MELEFINWLKSQVPPHPHVALGMGDDAALLTGTGDRQLVVTSDLLTDGVDFELDQCDPQRVGRKALAVNLSDLAAMAAEPLAAIVSVALPSDDAAALARGISRGILELAAEYNVAIAGGDTNTWPGELVISITALGLAPAGGALRRDGARPGDAILATGSFGGSILGHHFDFVPRVAEAKLLNQRYVIRAGIDVSDGLALDLSRVAEASGCGAAIKLDAIPVSDAARQLAQSSDPPGDPIRHALGDGEDFELLLAAEPAVADRMVRDQPLPCPITCLGRFVVERGLWQLGADGSLQSLQAYGWRHGQ